MRDWIKKLDDFLRISEQEILTHAGKISHEIAVAKAEKEFEQYHQKQMEGISPVEQDFEKAISEIERIEKGKK